MNALRISYFSAITTAVILLATAPVNALPTGAATSAVLAGVGNDAIVLVAKSAGGPAMRSGGPTFRSAPSFSGPRFSGPRFSGPGLGARQFRGNQFAWRGRNFRSRRFVGSPFIYGNPYYYGYCHRVLVPLITPRGVVMRWVRRCPGLYPYGYGYDSFWW